MIKEEGRHKKMLQLYNQSSNEETVTEILCLKNDYVNMNGSNIKIIFNDLNTKKE